MACLREQGHQAESCRSLAKAYLECRMERCASPACIRGCNEGSLCCGTVTIASVHLTVLLCRILRHSGQGCVHCACRNLMAQQDLKELGFRNNDRATNEGGSKHEQQSGVSEERGSQQGADANERKRQGFIAGIRR